MIDVQSARRQMIEQQVRAWDVLDLRVLEAMERVPREAFVPAAFRDLAFADMSLPIGEGQSMLAPNVEGRILQSLAVTPADRVLEVGTGSGYFAACLVLSHAPSAASRSGPRLPTPRSRICSGTLRTTSRSKCSTR